MTKEVFFDIYCKRCVHWDKAESEDPCYDCLDEPVNEDSHKPLYFKEKEELKGKYGTEYM